MQLMLDCKRFIERRSPSKSLTYTQLGWEAMGPFGKWAVNISVLGCNLGVCAGYMIFISSNLQVSQITQYTNIPLTLTPLPNVHCVHNYCIEPPPNCIVYGTHKPCSPFVYLLMYFSISHTQWSFSCLLYESGNETCFTVWEVYAMILPILILLTYLPSFKILAYAAYVGSVFLVVAMVVSADVLHVVTLILKI